MKNTSMYTGEHDWWGYDADHNYNPAEKEAILFDAAEDAAYYFLVRDVYDAHDTGSYTFTVSEYIEPLPVDPPQDFQAEPATNQNFQINLTWTAVPGAETYIVYRTDTPQDLLAPQYGDFTAHNTVPGDTTIFADSDINANTLYTYYMTAVIDSVESAPSNADDAVFTWANFKSDMDIIDASQGLPGYITITFENKYTHPDIIRYDVYRSPDEVSPVYTGPIHSFQASDPVGSVFNDSTITPGQYYFYCVKIVIDIEGLEEESDYSWFDSGLAE